MVRIAGLVVVRTVEPEDRRPLSLVDRIDGKGIRVDRVERSGHLVAGFRDEPQLLRQGQR